MTEATFVAFLQVQAMLRSPISMRYVHNSRKSWLYTYLDSEGRLGLPLAVSLFDEVCNTHTHTRTHTHTHTHTHTQKKKRTISIYKYKISYDGFCIILGKNIYTLIRFVKAHLCISMHWNSTHNFRKT